LKLIHRLSQLSARSKFPAEVWRREDGLTLIHQYMPTTPVVVADVWVKAGSIVEPDEWNGMAHFLEHMIFKGTDRLPPGAFDVAIENRGGMTNAATSHDYAHFFIATAIDHFPQTLPHLAELLLHASIPDAEFDQERSVVLEEILYSQDSPDNLAFEALIETLYQFHPYRRPILGTAEILKNRSPQEMRCFHRAHYRPDNMTVVVVGGIEQSPAIELVKGCFGNFAEPLECQQFTASAEPPLLEIRRREIRLPRLELTRLNLGWIGPGVDCLQDSYALDLLSVVLAGGRSARLVRELREERQFVQWIGSQFSLQRDSSLFTISAALMPEFLPVVEQIIGDRLHQLHETLVSQVELDRAKRQVCNDFAFSTETPAQLAGLYGYYQTLTDRAELGIGYPAQIQQLTAEDLKRVARQYLRRDRYAVTIAYEE
jgi:zinc protease